MKIAFHPISSALCGLLLISVAGCRMSTEALRPRAPLPSSFNLPGPPSDSGNMASQSWDIFYKDSCLTELIRIALQNNPDTRIALENIQLAEMEYTVTRSALLPRVDGVLNARVDKFGKYTMNGVGNDDTNRSESLPDDKRLPDPYRELFAGINFTWEANLWGKLSNQRKASLARFMASREASHGVMTLLISTMAEHYYTLIALDQERKVVQRNLELQDMGFELVKIQKIGGKVTQLAVDQFESQLLNTQSRLLKINQQIRVTEAVLNQLAGRYPQPLSRLSINQYDSLVAVSTGIPDQMIYQRPDLRQTELDLIAAQADVSVARAAFYPSLSVSAAAGFSAFDVSKWFLSPASAAYGLGGGLVAPIFQRGRIKALYTAANARQRIALEEYQKSLLNAYHEVYTVAHNHYNLAQQLELKQHEVDVLRRASINSNDLFTVGYATYLEVITAQRRLLDVELEFTNMKKELLQNRAMLYRALGGGWPGA
jgi:outer membrane protein, multidrug efflux system